MVLSRSVMVPRAKLVVPLTMGSGSVIEKGDAPTNSRVLEIGGWVACSRI
jgi:hypothetical protein